MYVEASVKERQEKRKAEKLAAKKARTKALFDRAYDEAGGSRGEETGGTFYEDWKNEMEQQAQVRVAGVSGRGSKLQQNKRACLCLTSR